MKHTQNNTEEQKTATNGNFDSQSNTNGYNLDQKFIFSLKDLLILMEEKPDFRKNNSKWVKVWNDEDYKKLAVKGFIQGWFAENGKNKDFVCDMNAFMSAVVSKKLDNFEMQRFNQLINMFFNVLEKCLTESKYIYFAI